MLLDRQDKAKSQELIAKSCYKLSVILPRGFHPFPSRTRKLSPAGPIVLHAKVCGRVGRCRHKIKAIERNLGGLFLFLCGSAAALTVLRGQECPRHTGTCR